VNLVWCVRCQIDADASDLVVVGASGHDVLMTIDTFRSFKVGTDMFQVTRGGSYHTIQMGDSVTPNVHVLMGSQPSDFLSTYVLGVGGSGIFDGLIRTSQASSSDP
jgi:hypothetical protein